MKKIILTIILFTVAATAFAGNMSFKFTKTTVENGRSETIGGFFYVKSPGNGGEKAIYFHVTYPVDQIVEYTRKQTTAYYPLEKKAVIIEKPDNSPQPDSMDPVSKPVDMKKAGFLLVGAEKVQAGGTREIWAPKKIIGPEAVIKMVELIKDSKGRLIRIGIRDRQDRIISRMTYADYRAIEDRQAPMTIEVYSGNEAGSMDEVTKLYDAKENAKLPEIIENFSVPKDAEVKKVKLN
jgi:hypothetical protein